MPGVRPKTIYLFRIIHFRNIEYVFQNGLHTRQSPNFDPNYVNIGNNVLIAQRQDYTVNIAGVNYGTLGEYIPFYFAGHSPMLLNIITGYSGVSRFPQDEIIYLVCRLENIVQHCSEWIFSDGHAKDRLTRFFNNLGDLDEIDWDTVTQQYWRPTEDDYDRQRRKQAEFLVMRHVPVHCIKGLVVKTEARKHQIEIITQALRLSVNVVADTTNKFYYP